MAPIPPSTHMVTSVKDDSQNAPPCPSQTLPTKKRKRKDNDASQPHILQQSTFRKATWLYFHLRLVTPETAILPSSAAPATNPSQSTSHSADISLLTVLPLLTYPLQAYLGVTGAAMPFDILKTYGRDVWIRVQRQDARAFQAALSGWVGSARSEHVPDVEVKDSGGMVKVAWRVKEEKTIVLGMGGDDRDIFGG